MKPIRRLVASIAVAICLLSAIAAQAQVLDQIPDQAMVIIKVNNLQAVSTKMGKLATDLQLVAQVPQMADPLGALQDKLKLANGLDKSGDAAFAVFDPALAGGGNDAVLMLVPVTDYKEFLGNFGDSKEENGITEASFPDSSKPAYIASWGKYAAVSPQKEVLSLKPTGVKVQGQTAKELATKDIVVYANMGPIKAKVQPMIAQGRGSISTEIGNALTGDNEKYVPVANCVVGEAMDIADAFLRDAHAATFGISIGETGITTTLMAEFEPDSASAKLVASFKNSDASLLGGLPLGKYLMFGGSINDPVAMGKIVDDVVAPIVTELSKLNGAESEAGAKYLAAMRKAVAANRQSTFGAIAPTGALGQESLLQIVGISTGDAPAIKSATLEAMSAEEDLMKSLGEVISTPKLTITPNAKTLGDVTFDLAHTDVNVGNGPGAAQAASAINMIYGQEGLNLLIGVSGDKVISGLCAPDAILTQVIATAKANEEPLAKVPGVVTAAAQLPKSRILTLYVPLDEIINTAGSYAGALGVPIQIQLPPDLPPIALTIGTEANVVRCDSYTSTDLVKAVVAQAMQLYMQRMGGGGGPGPGGL